MPGERLPMRKVRDVLRLSAGGMSNRQIAASLCISPTAAGECLRRARRAGLGWPLPAEMSDEALESRLYPAPANAKDYRPLPDWPKVHRELRRPEDERSPGVIALETTRANRVADALERDVGAGAYGGVADAGWIALACALGYCERRHRVWPWREGRPAQFSVPEANLVAAVREVLARHRG